MSPDLPRTLLLLACLGAIHGCAAEPREPRSASMAARPAPPASAQPAPAEPAEPAAPAPPAPEDPVVTARRAWRRGDAAALASAVAALRAAGRPDPELEAMSALAQAAPEQHLRVVSSDTPGAIALDTRLGVPIVEAKIGTHRGRFILDTGAEVSVIDTRAAARLGVRATTGTGVVAESNSGEAAVTMALVGKLQVAGLTLEQVPALLADLSAIPAQARVVGILGAEEVFGSSVITLDYAAGRLSRSHESRDEGAALLSLGERSIAGVEGRVEGGPSGTFLIDTGGRRSTLTNEYIDRAVTAGARWSISEPHEVEVRSVGIAARQRRFLATGRLCVGAGDPCFDLTEVPIDTTPADAGTGQIGKLGADAFAGRILELDYPARRMRLPPAAPAVAP